MQNIVFFITDNNDVTRAAAVPPGVKLHVGDKVKIQAREITLTAICLTDSFQMEGLECIGGFIDAFGIWNDGKRYMYSVLGKYNYEAF